jgi:FkbH-like protein
MVSMRLSEAMQINQQPVLPGGRIRQIHLVCGFAPLHLGTFIKARTKLRFPGDEVNIIDGLFGDLEGNLQRAREHRCEGAIVVMEWSDLDDRLGLRASAGWGSQVLADILHQAGSKVPRLEQRIVELASEMPVALVATTLTLPPLAHLPPAQTGSFELQLRCCLTGFLSRVGGCSGVLLVNDSTLARCSPCPSRHDVKMELHAGFPYTIQHAGAVAELSVECLFPPLPKKGLVTDLDETLWKGVLGDVGVNGVSWCLDDHSQPHALYQQLVASLAESGVLVAIASRNDPALVRQAFERQDVLLNEEQVFPIESNWGAKSESIGRILRAWNISAGDVVFVDDSRMDLAEVAEKYPGIECLRFPSDDPAGIVELLIQLRRRFGKSEIGEEDRLRLQSLRANSTLEPAPSAGLSRDFLARLEAKIKLEFSSDPGDSRAFELVNKTNQFNLNGHRYTEAEWQAYFRTPGTFLVTASYEDRFGPLGKIAVLGARAGTEKLHVDIWVMSCRSFSRDIEFQMLQRLYERFGAARIEFSYRSTERNGPLQEFFRGFFPTGVPADGLELTAEVFEHNRPQLFHHVIESSHE